jgi:leucyl/phenylalanyl-tRNA---protein transferase
MSGRGPFWIDPGDTSLSFPDISLALREPDGLLAIGGDLAPGRLLAAYRKGIFPWYGHDQPILWWSPDPRTLLFPERLKISRSLRKQLRQGRLRVTLDRAFDQVVQACAEPRSGCSGTWITTEMAEAYGRLHHQGYAHSVECWHDDRLVGGLYGVALGKVFFGESMFSRETDASKVAFAHLVRQLSAWDFALIDCQVYSSHLASLGAERISRSDFVRQLDLWCDPGSIPGTWTLDSALAARAW